MPNPPSHHYKVRTLRALGRAYGLRVFVETGTLYGETTELLSPHFDACFTIEIDPWLHARAQERFARKPSVRPILGDSAIVLPAIIAELDRPALFWLDGHWSGAATGMGTKETPILAELQAILAHRMEGHVIVIDDARLFDGSHDYPTIDELLGMVKRAAAKATTHIERDMIRILPPGCGDAIRYGPTEARS
jgi:hypothetical protein